MRSLSILLFCLVASCVSLVSATAPIFSLSQTTVPTDRGLVAGLQVENGVEFRGIPYAAAPIGSLRFAAPKLAPSWSGVYDATKLRTACTQAYTAPDGTMSLVGSEDCLTITVFTPRNSDNCPSGKMPVHVYLHGGAFVAGNGHGDVTAAGVGNGVNNGSSLAHKNECSVQVFPNYRLGAFGFLAVSDKSRNDGVGNFGILDQIAALKWVQRNIGFFGGDASRVTLSGESAGAFSVCVHLASPKSAGLFDGAILMSTTCDSSVFYTPLDKSVAWAESFVKSVGCDSTQYRKNSDLLKCLRALPAATLMSPDYANNFPVYRPLTAEVKKDDI